MKHERSSNFELLRLLCIFGILVMHTFAGIDTAASPGNMLANVFANSLFNTGVTCFILLSGYFGIRFDLKKLIGLDLMVIFFTVVGTVALGDFGVKDLIKSCIPVLSRRYGRTAGKRAFSQTASFTATRLQPDSNSHDLRCDAGCRQGTCTFCDDLSTGTLSGALSHRALFQKAAAPRNYRIHGAHLLRRRSADPASGCHLQHFFAGLFDLYYFYRCFAAVALP